MLPNVLELIIGIVFIYSLFSILVTQINSIISSVLRLRAKHLRNEITELIQDPVLRAKVVTHPLIRLVNTQMVLPNQRLSEEEAEKIINSAINNVNWINPRTFVEVLMSLIRVDSDNELFAALLDVIDRMPDGANRRRLRLLIDRIISTGEGIEDLREAIDSLELSVYRTQLATAFSKIEEEIGRLGLEPDSVISINAGLRKINNPYFRSALKTILSTSQSLKEAEQQITNWFNDGMSRASDAFTRSMQALSLLVGILIALLLNVDTLHLVRTFVENEELLAQVAQVARTTDLSLLEEAAGVPEEAENGSAEAPDAPDEMTTPTPPADSEEQSTDDVLDEIEQSFAEARDTLSTILDLNLPIGWHYRDLSGRDPQQPGNTALYRDARNLWNYLAVGANPFWLSMIAGKVLGLLVTMIAIAQGAPFWFNILDRLARGGRSSSDD